MKLHASWSLILFALGVIFGDILAMILKPLFFGHVIWLLVSLILLLLAIAFPRIPTMVAAFFSGAILIIYLATPIFIKANFASSLVDKEITITGLITKDPEADAGKQKLTLEEPSIGKIYTEVSNVEVKRSDSITISGVLSSGFGNYNGTIYRPTVQEIIHPEPGDILLKVRDFFATSIKAHLPEKEAGLSAGFLLGQKTGVDKSFQENLRTVGLTHIIVASGAHLGVLIGFARKIFGRLSRFASFLSGGIFTILFIGITGISASMLRAGLVVGLSLITWYFGRTIHPARLILLVAAATLLISPEYITDMSWQLSFASFSGILILAPILIEIFYGKHKQPGFVSSTLFSSIAATLLCTPILIYYYGSISLISVLLNLLVLPTVSFAMGFTFLTGVTAILVPAIAPLIGFLDKLLLDYQISIVEFFGTKKEFVLELPANNPLFFLLYFPSITLMIYWFFHQRKNKTPMLA